MFVRLLLALTLLAASALGQASVRFDPNSGDAIFVPYGSPGQITYATLNAAMNATPLGSKRVRIIGEHTVTGQIDLPGDDLRVVLDPQTRITINHAGAVGLFAATGNNVTIEGGTIIVPTFVANQKIISMSGQNLWVEHVTFNCTDATASAFTGTAGPTTGHGLAFLVAGNANSGLAATNPLSLIAFSNATAKRVRGNTFYPNKGVTCIYSEGSGAADSPGNMIVSGNVFRSVDAAYLGVQQLCWRAIDCNGDEYGTISGNTFYQLGTIADPLDAIVFLRDSITVGVEAGHFSITGNLIERCPSPSGIKLWGVLSCGFSGNTYGLNGPMLGSDSGADAAGEAAILVTGDNGVVGGAPTTSFVANGNELHNLAESATDGTFMHLQRCSEGLISGNVFGVVASNQAITVTASGVSRTHISNNAFRSNSGAARAIWINGAANIPDGIFVGNNTYEGFAAGVPILDESNAGASGRRKILTGVQDSITGNDAAGLVFTADTITFETATDIIKDSTTGIGVAGFVVGDVVLVRGSSVAANNSLHQVISVTPGTPSTIGLLANLADDLTAGETIVVSKVAVLPTTNAVLDK